MHRSNSRYLSVMLVILLMVASYMVGAISHSGMLGARPLWSQIVAPTTDATIDTSANFQSMQLIQDVMRNIQRDYVEPISAKDTEEMTYDGIRGMLTHLNDPYTRFMDPKEFKEFNEDNAGSFAGIGATLTMTELNPEKEKPGQGTVAPVECPVCATVISDRKTYRVSVVEPLENSPAIKAGIRPGDFILKVDGKPTDGQMVNDVTEKIRGTEGTKVTLTIARQGIEKPLDITITRATIEVPAVSSKMLDDKIGYIRLFSFNDKTFPETRNALATLNSQGARGIVLDLRGNPGGLLTECIKVATLFLPKEDKVIVTTRERLPRQPYAYNRLTDPQSCKQPLVVLINKGSASASEILSGALKDYKRGTLIGETTFGKALVQTVLKVGPNQQSAMAITTAHYYTPSGYDLGHKGITPDVVVPLNKDVKQIGTGDNQALAAIKQLKEQMAAGH